MISKTWTDRLKRLAPPDRAPLQERLAACLGNAVRRHLVSHWSDLVKIDRPEDAGMQVAKLLMRPAPGSGCSRGGAHAVEVEVDGAPGGLVPRH